MSEIIRHSKIDYANMMYEKPIQQNNWYFGSITYKNKSCMIQSPRLIFKRIEEDASTKQKYLIAQVKENDFSFYDTLVSLDDLNVMRAYKESKEWFQKEIPVDILESMYRRMSQSFKQGDIPEIKLKLPCYKQSVSCKIYDIESQEANVSQLEPGCTLLCILQIKGLKFLKKEYYCDHQITQLKIVEPAPYSNKDQCLIEDDEEDISQYEHELVDQQAIRNAEEKVRLNQEIDKVVESMQPVQQKLDKLSHQLEKLKQERELLD